MRNTNNSNSIDGEKWDDEDWDQLLDGSPERLDAQIVHDKVHDKFLDWMIDLLSGENPGGWIQREVTMASICMSTQMFRDQFREYAEQHDKWAEDEAGDPPVLIIDRTDILALIRSAFMIGICFQKDYSDGKVDLG